MPLTNVQILHAPEAGICAAQLGIGPRNYARQLARYMRDPSKVRANTMNEWGRAPTLRECAEMIAAARAERQRYRDETERLGENDKDAIDFAPSATDHAKRAHKLATKIAAEKVVLPELEPANDDELRAPPVLIGELIEAIAKAFKVTAEDILGPCRAGVIKSARIVVCKVLHLRGQSYPQIGRRINRDHSSVINAVHRFDTHATDKMRAVASFFAGDKA
jgi:hypothetical protein